MPYRVIRPDGLFIQYKKTPQEKQIEKVENENKDLRKEIDSMKEMMKKLIEKSDK